MKASTTLERTFDTFWEQLKPAGLPDPTAQVLFHADRDWAWDRAWVQNLVCLDLHGGGFNHNGVGAHHRELGMANDMAKQNEATVMGWRVILASTSMLENDPAGVITCITTLLYQPVLSPDAEYAMWLARVRNLTAVGAAVENNGILVERLRYNEFRIKTGSGTYTVGRKLPLKEAQTQVLDLILRGKSAAATPNVIRESGRDFSHVNLIF